MQNERGRYFSEGKFEILGHPRTDGYDALTWIAGAALVEQARSAHSAARPLPNGSCSLPRPTIRTRGHGADGVGAGIGRVGEFHEQGNWYRGGVPRTLFSIWLYGVDNPLRAQIPERISIRDAAVSLAAYSDLNPKKPDVTWAKQVWHLPLRRPAHLALGEPQRHE